MVEVANKGLQLPPPTEPLTRPSTQQGNDPLSFLCWELGLHCGGVELNTKDGQASRGALQLLRVKGEAYLRAQLNTRLQVVVTDWDAGGPKVRKSSK